MTLLELYQLAEKRNITVDYFPMRDCKSLSLQEGFIAIDVDRLEDTREETVVLAHEIGHFETGSFYNIFSPLDIREKHERRAWKWAYEKQIPREDFAEAIRAGMTEVWELADYFNVPGEFMAGAMEYYQAANFL